MLSCKRPAFSKAIRERVTQTEWAPYTRTEQTKSLCRGQDEWSGRGIPVTSLDRLSPKDPDNPHASNLPALILMPVMTLVTWTWHPPLRHTQSCHPGVLRKLADQADGSYNTLFDRAIVTGQTSLQTLDAIG
jgi:hypothetical protein